MPATIKFSGWYLRSGRVEACDGVAAASRRRRGGVTAVPWRRRDLRGSQYRLTTSCEAIAALISPSPETMPTKHGLFVMVFISSCGGAGVTGDTGAVGLRGFRRSGHTLDRSIATH